MGWLSPSSHTITAPHCSSSQWVVPTHPPLLSNHFGIPHLFREDVIHQDSQLNVQKHFVHFYQKWTLTLCKRFTSRLSCCVSHIYDLKINVSLSRAILLILDSLGLVRLPYSNWPHPNLVLRGKITFFLQLCLGIWPETLLKCNQQWRSQMAKFSFKFFFISFWSFVTDLRCGMRYIFKWKKTFIRPKVMSWPGAGFNSKLQCDAIWIRLHTASLRCNTHLHTGQCILHTATHWAHLIAACTLHLVHSCTPHTSYNTLHLEQCSMKQPHLTAHCILPHTSYNATLTNSCSVYYVASMIKNFHLKNMIFSIFLLTKDPMVWQMSRRLKKRFVFNFQKKWVCCGQGVW